MIVGEFMETIKGKVIKVDNKRCINIKKGRQQIKIPLTEDKPIDVKNAFNELIEWIQEGEFKIELEDVGTDLFSQVAEEYILQLNREIKEVREEMDDLGLVYEQE